MESMFSKSFYCSKFANDFLQGKKNSLAWRLAERVRNLTREEVNRMGPEERKKPYMCESKKFCYVLFSAQWFIGKSICTYSSIISVESVWKKFQITQEFLSDEEFLKFLRIPVLLMCTRPVLYNDKIKIMQNHKFYSGYP